MGIWNAENLSQEEVDIATEGETLEEILNFS